MFLSNKDLVLELYNLNCYCGRHDGQVALTDGFEIDMHPVNTSGLFQPVNSSLWPVQQSCSTTSACGRFVRASKSVSECRLSLLDCSCEFESKPVQFV